MFKIYKITWKLERGVSLEKANLPEFYKVPLEQKDWSNKKIKDFLTKKYCYLVKKIEEI